MTDANDHVPAPPAYGGGPPPQHEQSHASPWETVKTCLARAAVEVTDVTVKAAMFLRFWLAGRDSELLIGLVIGATDDQSTLIWVRGSARQPKVKVTLRQRGATNALPPKKTVLNASSDFTGTLEFTGLQPATDYEVTAEFEPGDRPSNIMTRFAAFIAAGLARWSATGRSGRAADDIAENKLAGALRTAPAANGDVTEFSFLLGSCNLPIGILNELIGDLAEGMLDQEDLPTAAFQVAGENGPASRDAESDIGGSKGIEGVAPITIRPEFRSVARSIAQWLVDAKTREEGIFRFPSPFLKLNAQLDRRETLFAQLNECENALKALRCTGNDLKAQFDQIPMPEECEDGSFRAYFWRLEADLAAIRYRLENNRYLGAISPRGWLQSELSVVERAKRRLATDRNRAAPGHAQRDSMQTAWEALLKLKTKVMDFRAKVLDQLEQCLKLRMRLEALEIDKPIAFTVHAGDQIYFDIPLLNGLESGIAGLSHDTPEPTVENYRKTYRNAWFRDAATREFLGRMPHYMILDDHDIVDQFANDLDQYGSRAIRSPADYLSAARPAYTEYVDSRQRSRAVDYLDYTFEHGGCHFFVMDTRTGRFLGVPGATGGIMISPEQEKRFTDWLDNNKERPKFVVSSVPFIGELHPDYDGTIPSQDRSVPWYEKPLEEHVLPERDDKWCGMPFVEQRSRLIEYIADNNIERLVFLTGDTHCCYHATMTIGDPYQGGVTLHELMAGPFYQLEMNGYERFDALRRTTTKKKGIEFCTRMHAEEFHGSAPACMMITLQSGEDDAPLRRCDGTEKISPSAGRLRVGWRVIRTLAPPDLALAMWDKRTIAQGRFLI